MNGQGRESFRNDLKIAQAMQNWEPAATQRKPLARRIISGCDWTSLDSRDTPERIANLCESAKQFGVAAVCVVPSLLPVVVESLRESGVAACCVAAGFPHGLSPLAVRLAEIEWCVAQGAAELDVVINRSLFLSGELPACERELAQMRKACGASMMKVIVEVCDLGSNKNVWDAASMALNAGADFVKTSTGKGDSGATLESVAVIWNAVKLHAVKTGLGAGVKVAGGVRTAADAFRYFELSRRLSGGQSLSRRNFRIGASTLMEELTGIVQGEKS